MMKDMGVDLPSPPGAPLRLRVIDTVLATDMAQHQRLVEDLAAEMGSRQSLQDVDKLVLKRHLVLPTVRTLTQGLVRRRAVLH